MVYKALHKAMTFTRVLKRFNRRNNCTLTAKGFYILLSVNYLTDGKFRRVTVSEIQRLLKTNSHTTASNLVKRELNKLIDFGFLEKEGPYPARYGINIVGKNALSFLEQSIRKSRIDK